MAKIGSGAATSGEIGSVLPRRSPRLVLRWVAALCVCALVAACNQDVYSDLTEAEANQMLAELISHGVGATKTSKGKEGFTISVDNADMLRALAVLKDAGFPRNSRDSIGKVFQKSGIMSSPFEERVRYIYALGEEVAQTISHIDGVVTARVHIVLPDAPQLGQPVKPSSAAVFIRYQAGVDIEYFVPQIRRLVSSSIEGLDYGAVTVVLDEAIPSKTAAPASPAEATTTVLGLKIRNADLALFWTIVASIAAAVGLVVAGLATAGVLWWRSRRKARGGGAGLPAIEPS